MLAGKWEDLTGHVLQGRYSLRSLISAGPSQAEFVAHAVPALEESEPLSVTLIAPGEADFERQLAQIATAQQLAHPKLLRILDGGKGDFKGTTLLYVVTEPTAATLAQVIAEAPLDLTEGTALTNDLLAGLEYIHGQGFVCGTLEPDTVVRAGTHWKLADLSQLRRPGTLEKGVATGPNLPPEASLGSIGPSWDIWALGAILRAALADEVRRSPVFDAIIAGCLEPDPAKRLSPGEISRLLDSKKEPAPPRRPRGALAAVVSLVLLLVVALAVVALREKPAAAPTKAPPSAAPDRSVSPPVDRPSAFTGKIESEALPSPAQSQSLGSDTATSAGTQPAAKAESESGSQSRSARRVKGGGSVGEANFSADNLDGRPTASGELFSNAAMTAAHPSFPLGARVRVTNLKNGKSVVVRVNDRAPLNERVIITVTRAAAEQLGFVNAGSARVRIELLR